jgi:hypothetical protein
MNSPAVRPPSNQRANGPSGDQTNPPGTLDGPPDFRFCGPHGTDSRRPRARHLLATSAGLQRFFLAPSPRLPPRVLPGGAPKPARRLQPRPKLPTSLPNRSRSDSQYVRKARCLIQSYMLIGWCSVPTMSLMRSDSDRASVSRTRRIGLRAPGATS